MGGTPPHLAPPQCSRSIAVQNYGRSTAEVQRVRPSGPPGSGRWTSSCRGGGALCVPGFVPGHPESWLQQFRAAARNWSKDLEAPIGRRIGGGP
eukprot:15475673-Alexandrium_andersonii.AAC.1